MCSAPNCLRAWYRDQEKAKAVAKEAARRSSRKHGDRYVGWAYGAIVEDLRKRSRRARRKG